MGNAKFTVVSLFTGAMGLDIGLHRTGRFKLLACVEKEKAFADTIRLNRDRGRLDSRDVQVINQDICKVDPLCILESVGLAPGELDVLIGGPPCQSFSTAGKRGTVQDHRGTLLWQFLRFVEVMRPKFFVMENVRGLLSAALRHRHIKERPSHGGRALKLDEQPGSVVRQFAEDLGRLDEAPYRLDCFEVNAVNYRAAQAAERGLFIGNRYGDVVEFPSPTHAAPNSAITAPGLFDHEHPAGEFQPWRTLGDAIAHLEDPAPVIMDFSPRKKRYLAMVPPGSNWRSLPLDVQRESMGAVWSAKGGRSGWWRRLSFDLPCPTLVTMPNHAGTSLCHPTEVRALSLKEYQLIQEFPEDWEFCGSPAQQYAQVGNAVPVRLGEVAGGVIAERLDALAARRWRRYSETRERYRIVYVQSHVRTRQWFKQGEVFVWNDGAENGNAKYAAPKTRRAVRPLVQECSEKVKAVQEKLSGPWEPIDREMTVEGRRYLISVKSGPWTMNQSHANGMIEKLPTIHKQTGCSIVLGIMYGRYENLNNKPGLVETQLGSPPWFDYLVGRDFWEFISGVKDIHKELFRAIRQAQKEFGEAHKDETFHEKLVGNRLKIAASLRKAFNVKEEEDFWETLFAHMF